MTPLHRELFSSNQVVNLSRFALVNFGRFQVVNLNRSWEVNFIGFCTASSFEVSANSFEKFNVFIAPKKIRYLYLFVIVIFELKFTVIQFFLNFTPRFYAYRNKNKIIA